MLRRLAVLAAIGLLAPLAAAGAAPPSVDATAYIVVDQATGETLARRAVDRELPMASTTKIMTALIVLERASLSDRMTVSRAAAEIEGSSGLLEAGESLRVDDLLTALLVASGNDAAVTLAEGVAGSQAAFVGDMNERARELGLTNTRFANPHGLDEPGHHSSVSDLVRLARVAMRDAFFRRTVAMRRATIPGPRGVGVRSYESENALLDLDPEADGVKTGMTDDAGFTLVVHATRRPLGVSLYAAIIGSPGTAARARDGRRLLDWGFAQYARATVVPAGAVLGRVPVQGRPGISVPYRAASALGAPVRLGGSPLSQRVVVPARVRGPIPAGRRIGRLSVRQGGRVIGRRALVTAEAAGGPGLWDRLRSGVGALVP